MAGVLLIVGSVIFFVGAAIGVPGVFTEADAQQRLRMLTAHLTMWRIAQPLYGLGPIVVAVGVGLLAAVALGRGARVMFGAGCVVMAIGALAWSWSLYLRGTRVTEFARGTLPGWPFAIYVLLTIVGLALVGLGLLAGRFPTWLGWLALSADVLFLVAYLWFKDIPPFVFYLLLLLVGAVIV
jgi:hypothetical protein